VLSNPYQTNTPLLVCPTATDGATITPSGVADTNSNWAVLTASANADWRLASVIVRPGSFADGNFYEVDIGVGAIGAEVVIASVRGYSGNNSGGSAELGSVFHLSAPCNVISSGDRVVARLRQVSTNTSTWAVAIQYWRLPLSGSKNVMPVSTIGPVCIPSGSRITVTTHATINTYGSWVELTPSTDTDWIITDLVMVGGNFLTWDVQIGIGSAGNEVPLWTVSTLASWFASSNAWQGGPWTIPFNPPFGPIPTGTRVAVRAKCQNSAGAKSFGTGFVVLKKVIAGLATNDKMLFEPYQLLTVSGAGGWTNYSGWYEFIANTSKDIVIVQLSGSKDNTGLTQYDIGVGSAGNEIPISSIIAHHGVGFGGGRFNITWPYGRLIPAGSRVSMRLKNQGTSAGLGHDATFGYIEVSGITPDFENWTEDYIIGELVYDNLPTALQMGVFTGASAWQNGSWVELDASAGKEYVVLGMTMNGVSVPAEAEFDLGFGAAGFEQVAHTIRWDATDTVSGTSFVWTRFNIPLIIPISTRLSFRARCSLATPRTYNFNLILAERPIAEPFVATILSGLYELIPNKTADTLVSAYEPFDENDYKKPDPSFQTAVIEDK